VKTKPPLRDAAGRKKLQTVTKKMPILKALESRAAPRCIDGDNDVRDGVLALRRDCAVIRMMHDLVGDPPLRRRTGGFEGLARIVIGQQVSVASANAIWARFETTVQPLSVDTIRQLSDSDLRGAGLSSPKIRTLRAISATPDLDFAALSMMDEAHVRETLTAISGIGPWTTDVYLMFCLGRADVFAPGDLALQVAAQMAMNLEARPSALELAEIAERWQPWRAVAARLLWAYYAAIKAAKSGQPV
jgi:DNA-3-methyladenine glycosylase II